MLLGGHAIEGDLGAIFLMPYFPPFKNCYVQTPEVNANLAPLNVDPQNFVC
jgi:hypothetical protein